LNLETSNSEPANSSSNFRAEKKNSHKNYDCREVQWRTHPSEVTIIKRPDKKHNSDSNNRDDQLFAKVNISGECRRETVEGQ
jgi:hypothetical protein